MAQDQRPFIHLNLAMNQQGQVASAEGNALPLSCLDDWRRVHHLRERCDAIAVGARTWIKDRPRLTVRGERLGREPQRQPARIIFAGSHQCVVVPDGRPTFVIGSAALEYDEITLIRAQGWRLREPLQWLHAYGIRSLLVEGGPTLIRSFLSEGLTDLVTLYVRTTCVESAIKAASALFSELSSSIAAQPLGEGILLSNAPLEGHVEWPLSAPEPEIKVLASSGEMPGDSRDRGEA
ncbi:MAG TPA: dihydrofolate reductase family protein [Pyrinomonadaceae bacterium]|jgi:riboflavin-specific deaminase-like protein|nr:dihydrofolate reductase family protein [Pyrinomonadaceae bacterium]